eukprot:232822-Pyramimonas_sp.AAC.1
MAGSATRPYLLQYHRSTGQPINRTTQIMFSAVAQPSIRVSSSTADPTSLHSSDQAPSPLPICCLFTTACSTPALKRSPPHSAWLARSPIYGGHLL